MAEYYVIPAIQVAGIEAQRFIKPGARISPGPNTVRWALRATPTKDGRWVIPADVVAHPAYAAIAARLQTFTKVSLTRDELDIPVAEVV